MKRLSIIIPVYNVEAYLSECLDSVLETNGFKGEVVCVNDGSTDGSAAILKKYATKYANVRICTQSNQGLSAARNTGIENATGDYLCFLDSDDYLLPGAIAAIEEQIATHKEVDVVCCNTAANGERLSFYKSLRFENGTGADFCNYYFDQLHYAYPSEAWHYVCRRQFLLDNQIQFKYGFLHEDEDFTPRILLAAQNVCILSTPILYYRVKREGAISATIKEKNFFDTVQIVRDLYTHFEQHQAPKMFYRMQFVLLLQTLYEMHRRHMALPKDGVEYLQKLSISVQQKRAAQIAKHNIELAYRYDKNQLPHWQRRILNLLLKIMGE